MGTKEKKMASSKGEQGSPNFLWSFKCDLPTGLHHGSFISILQHSWESKGILPQKGLKFKEGLLASWFPGRNLLPPVWIQSCISVMMTVKKWYLLSTWDRVFLNQTFIDKEVKLTFCGLEVHQWIEGWLKEKSLERV